MSDHQHPVQDFNSGNTHLRSYKYEHFSYT
jgi:hypothetical protein